MRLRYRLFIWVGMLFALAFVISIFVEERVTQKSFNETRRELIKILYRVDEQKRRAIETYVADMLWKIQAQVDATLQGVNRYQQIKEGFAPSLQNLKNGTWLNSASLMITNQWIGFIQNINEGALASSIIVDDEELVDTYHFPGSSDFHFVAIRDSKNPDIWKGPYIGVILELQSLLEGVSSPPYQPPDDRYSVLFTPNAILNFKGNQEGLSDLRLSVNLLEPFLNWIQIPSETLFLDQFIKRIERTKAFLEKQTEALPNQEQWAKLVKKREEDEQNGKAPCFSHVDEKFKKMADPKSVNYRETVLHYLQHYIEDYSKIGLIWGISALSHAKLFDQSPISPNAPYGMAVVNQEQMCGKAVLSDRAFQKEKTYDIHEALSKNALPSEFLTTHLDIISPEGIDHVYFGTTLRMEGGNRTGYLTIGVHGRSILESLSRSTNETSMFVAQDRVIAVFDPKKGELPGNSPWYQVPMQDLLNQTSGIVTIQGEEYVFLHIAPYEHIDLHFFTFNPKSKAFLFIDSVNESSKKLIETVSMQMRLASVAALFIVLILLNNIAKRVTKPIAHLAKVTEEVAKGKLHEIEIPQGPKGKTKDEVKNLYHAFFEMLKGLREKEKVRGVLNKVVSKEIAEEALKGNIKLGGEDKRITVFFADIRGFTSMTEHMEPKDVIQLINNCMTKISKKIDEYGGVIDKYVGDEVMALFGAPIEKKESALNAVKCGVDIIETFAAWNRDRKSKNEVEIKLGIGIHTGTVVAGNMGAEDRLNYTVLGSNVNLASRLCQQAEAMQVLISEATLEEKGVREKIDCQPLDSIELKGFTQSTKIFAAKSY